MKRLVVASILCLVASSCVWAIQPEVVGGVRDGLAVGIMGENPIAKNAALRFGVEGDTGKQPLILFAEGKFYLTNFGPSQMSLGAGLVGYSGNESKFGLSLALIFNRAFNVVPLFVEAGVDIVDTGRLRAQVGYKLY